MVIVTISVFSYYHVFFLLVIWCEWALIDVNVYFVILTNDIVVVFVINYHIRVSEVVFNIIVMVVIVDHLIIIHIIVHIAHIIHIVHISHIIKLKIKFIFLLQLTFNIKHLITHQIINLSLKV